VPIYSTVTGRVTDGQEFDAIYWWRNLREPVIFSSAVQELVAGSHNIFLEINPHPTLLSSIQRCLQQVDREATLLASLRRGEPATLLMRRSLATLWVMGQPVNWTSFYSSRGRCVRLPNYAWQRERCWLEVEGAAQQRSLLGQPVDLAHADGSRIWQF